MSENDVEAVESVVQELQTEVPRKSDEELREFVLGCCDGRILTSAQVPAGRLHLVFLPIALGALHECTKEFLESIGVVYEWRDKAGPLAINGLPQFFSANLLHREDWAKALPAILREEERRKSIEL